MGLQINVFIIRLMVLSHAASRKVNAVVISIDVGIGITIGQTTAIVVSSILFTHTPCGSVGLQTDSFSFFFSPPSHF